MSKNDVVKEWLDECRTESTRELYEYQIRVFQEWYGKPLSTFLNLSPKDMRHEALKFQSEQVGKMKPNTIISVLTALGSFCAYNDKPLMLRGKRLRTQIDLDSHVFTNGDLAKMFEVADTEEKAIVATFTSLGWEVSSILELKRDFMEKQILRAKEEGKQFIYFLDQRPKTGVLRLGVINPLAIEWLSKMLEQARGPGLFSYTTKEGVNKMIQRLVREAHLIATGRIHTHLMRKWVMSGLSRAGFNDFQIKYMMGKAIPLSDMTYLQTLQQEIEGKYPAAYENYLTLKPMVSVKAVTELGKQVVQQSQELTLKTAEIETMKETLDKAMLKIAEAETSRKDQEGQLARDALRIAELETSIKDVEKVLQGARPLIEQLMKANKEGKL
jgi:hypothetical protein